MNKIKNNKLIVLNVLFIVIILSILISDHFKYSVDYIICDGGYSDCKTYAKFTSMMSCESHKDFGAWLCNSMDPNNIQCKVSQSRTVTAFCNQ